MPSSDCSIKYSNLNAEQTCFLVFTILSNSVKGCIIDLKKKKIKNSTLLICIQCMCSCDYRNNYYSFVFYEIDVANLIKTFINDLMFY